MRQFWIAICMAVLAFVPACASYQTEATAPTVKYSYSDDDNYAEVAEKADEHCESNYGKNAQLVDREREGSGYEATFACK